MTSAAKKTVALRALEEYASQTTIHGISYIFDKKLPAYDRMLWTLICLSFSILAILMTNQSFSNWQSDMVITTLKNTAKPVGDLKFPMIVICSEGMYMNNLEQKLWEDFQNWRELSSLTENMSFALSKYMLEQFEIQNSSINILDILDTMVAKDVEVSMAANAVRENIDACSSENNQDNIQDVSDNNYCRKMYISSNKNDVILDSELSLVPGIYEEDHVDEKTKKPVFKNVDNGIILHYSLYEEKTRTRFRWMFKKNGTTLMQTWGKNITRDWHLKDRFVFVQKFPGGHKEFGNLKFTCLDDVQKNGSINTANKVG